ncbi:hypothetical protein AACJ27_003683 [Escherichia coli]|nr:hypothetical protein [Escherichia coli]
MDSRYASKKTTFTVLTVPRALSRIHRNGKSTWLAGWAAMTPVRIW